MKNFIDSPRNMVRKLPYLVYGIFGAGLAYMLHQGSTSDMVLVKAIAEIAPTLGILIVVMSIVVVVVRPNKEGK